VAVRVVATCGAGGHPCPHGFIAALDRTTQGDAVFFATPTTALWGGQGCGAELIAPFGEASVTEKTVHLHEKWVGVGPDCFGTVFAVIRFAQPVFDMHSRLTVRVTDLVRHRTTSAPAMPAPALARWVTTLAPSPS